MGTSAPSNVLPAQHAGSGRLVAIRRVVAPLAPLVVLGGLTCVAYWGHRTGWQLPGAETRSFNETRTASRTPVVRLTPSTVQPGQPLPGQETRIEFESSAAVTEAGVEVTPAWQASLTEQVTGAGEVGFDPTRAVRLSSRVGGTAYRVFKTTGDQVRGGELLALIASAEVAKARSDFQQALVQTRLRERVRDDLHAARAVTSPAQLREAEAGAKDANVRALSAAQALTNLGLPVRREDYQRLSPGEAAARLRLVGLEDVPEAERNALPANLLPVRAPFPGVVLSAEVVAGEVVEGGKMLFEVVDPRQVVLTIHVASVDAGRVAGSQKAWFRPDGGGDEYAGTVTSVGTAAEESTRTVPVRAAADNAAGTLRASTLGRGRVVLRETPKTLLIPHGAVQSFRGQSVVFVRDPAFLTPNGAKAFSARVIQTGGRDEVNTEVLSGLAAGDVVSTKGSAVFLGALTRAAAGR